MAVDEGKVPKSISNNKRDCLAEKSRPPRHKGDALWSPHARWPAEDGAGDDPGRARRAGRGDDEVFEQNLSSMPGKDAQALLDQGKAIRTADTDQNAKRSKDLPVAVQDFYDQKGRLYLAPKATNDAGHEQNLTHL